MRHFQGNKASSHGSACHLINWICSRWHADARGCWRSNCSSGVGVGWGALNEWLCPRATRGLLSSGHKRWMRNFMAFFTYYVVYSGRGRGRQWWEWWEIKRMTCGQGLNPQQWKQTSVFLHQAKAAVRVSRRKFSDKRSTKDKVTDVVLNILKWAAEDLVSCSRTLQNGAFRELLFRSLWVQSHKKENTGVAPTLLQFWRKAFRNGWEKKKRNWRQKWQSPAADIA